VKTISSRRRKHPLDASTTALAAAVDARARAVDPLSLGSLAFRMIETPSPPGHEGPMALVVASALRGAGADDVSLDEEFPGSPSVIAWINGRTPGPTLQWHGHLDAIEIDHSPPRREGEYIFGRGASDMKGAMSAMVECVRVLKDLGLPRRGRILLTFHGLHEMGGSAPLLALIRRGIVGDAVIIGELGSGEQLIISSPGLTFFRYAVQRQGDVIHETNALPGMGDPLRIGNALFGRLMSLRDELHDNTAHQRGSLFVGRFVAGDYPNRLPATCVIEGTRRHSAGWSIADTRAELKQIAHDALDNGDPSARSSITIETTFPVQIEAYEIDPACRIAQSLRFAYRFVSGNELIPTTSRAVGNAADFVNLAGIPAVYYGCQYATAHSDNERLSVSELTHLVRVYSVASAIFLESAELA
jgi:acetylornithine deacetylase/succinyl-diaminopimelate desuccinylase-like protein